MWGPLQRTVQPNWKSNLLEEMGKEWKLVCVQERYGRRETRVWGAAQELEGVKQETGCQGGQMRCCRINTFDMKEMGRVWSDG